MTAKMAMATLGGGCFWCLEAVFEQMIGVDSVVSGYCGGDTDNPGYEAVCSGRTGHAEVVRLTFDPELCDFRQILEVFFAIHDPTTRNRQGNDVGTQYRSVIFFHSPEQEETARSLIAELEQAGAWTAPVVTELLPVTAFFAAESHHQQYFRRNGDQPYCQFVVSPKLAKFRQRFAARVKANR
ncbi:peptide-methionine (S)-S-oxide reductase MsrA [Accumulibacter sp.]|jgi:peptide-methionine (S)-S-oxide reductase|uniref:peptide-methionine (S)-S-oxide reductase MsrA n=1 Tax=Accumulibacter sp. TaxID=2053492 RepID=UPI001AD4271C|nr:peptide-methionine (S)-S-oxide reductase MsrA [Accumulibacter sp.]MBN8451900.1 peptide-methionine (S)-S-oxide reductase MsrA [Accumulibacter sp.]MBO3707812.1 peptide-methionine (S)-S-oxide reductase MsrA [Candidatus Accumulibacter conexus]